MLTNQFVGLKRADFKPIIITVVIIGILRYAIGMFFVDLRGPLGIAWIVFCAPIIIIALVSLIAISIVIFRSIRTSRSFIPSLTLLGGLILTLFIPLPAAAPTPEEILFFERQSDFEQVVELKRINKLDRKGNTGQFFTIPEKYRNLSNNVSIYSIFDPEHGLYIEFQPYDFYHPIVFVEIDTIKSCGYDLNVETKLIDHWYVCERDWN